MAAGIYRKELEGTGLRMWDDPPWGTHVYFKMPLALPPEQACSLDWVIKAISAENVSCRPTHPPLSSIGWLKEYAASHDKPYLPADTPNALETLPRIFEVETGPGMTTSDMAESARAIRKVVSAL
jgi:dTDP-4-amino-4,6-dideoxygalactose transaminase